MKNISVRAYSLIATSIIIVVAMIADHNITASYNQTVVDDLQINQREVQALIKNEYASYQNDIYFLHSTPPISGLTRANRNGGLDPLDNTTTAQWQNRLTNIFLGFVENNPAYFQLRLLDHQGNETIAASYGGTGLGLSICREILTLLNGSISVESEEQAGSTFTIIVPLDLWQVREKEKPRLADCNAVVVIENEPLRKVLQNLLVCNGATAMVYHRMLSLTEAQSCDYLFVEQCGSYYSDFAHYWQQWVNEKRSLPALYLIAKSAADADQSLPQAAILVQPLYRTVFLANVIDSRAKKTSLPAHTTNSRRSSDVRNDHSATAVDISDQHILIVDDNEINRQVAEFVLEPYGPTVSSAINGADAIEQLRNNPNINLVLMDCNMPVLNGYDATRAIRDGQAGEEHCNIPIIAMTANALKGEREKCYDAGMNNYLTKPIDAGEFIGKVTGSLNSAAVVNAQDLSHGNPAQGIWQCEEALVRLDNNKALLQKLLSLFIVESHEKRETLEQAIAAEDWEKVRFTAHAFKGNAAEVGANALKEMLTELEHQAKTAQQAEMQSVYEHIARQLPILIEQFEKFIEAN